MSEETKTTLSPESAQAELDKFIEFYELKRDNLNEDQQDVYDSATRSIRDAIIKGRIEILEDDNGNVIVKQNLRKPGATPITYKVMTANAKRAMGGKKNQGDFDRLYNLMSSLSGLGNNAINQLVGPDMSTMENLGYLFLML